MLISLAGLPGTGKSTLARVLAQRTGALWLRIDSIEQAIRDAGLDAGEAGYRAAYGIAAENLALGRAVVADGVNPWMETRDAWREIAGRASARLLEIEVICSDQAEHRRRVETRAADVPGLRLPDWRATLGVDYRPWTRPPLVVDTAGRAPVDCAEQILALV